MILVLDNYDSFTYNLVQYVGELGAQVLVKRNDEISVDDAIALGPEAIIVSPGPCTPTEAGISVELIRRAGPTTPLLGVCLGHQAIGEAFGGRVVRATRVMHGKQSRILHDGSGLFRGVPSPFAVMRYHSLVVERATLPTDLVVTAMAEDLPDEIHALQHRHHPIWGVQFHPESILTEHGKLLIQNFLSMASSSVGAA
ncbi:MAG: aminodeoxychorismate/anthranilate synthase component II [Gemmatimonadaceae bacterium]|nr:aminodeoxychorismate/anthranilate synthase component II [Gemmatimonadaceae bacterium]